MASNWKFATLPAQKRLEMIREGNGEVFESEKARALSAIRSRTELGLPAEEQIQWANTLGYNNALYNAKGLGIDENEVEKTGYAERWLLGDGSGVKLVGVVKSSTADAVKDIAEKKNALLDKESEKAVAALEEETEEKKKAAYAEALRELPSMRERFANLGLSGEGGTVRSHELQFNIALDETLAELDRLLIKEKSDILSEKEKRKLDNLSDALEKMTRAIKEEKEDALARAELELRKKEQEQSAELQKSELEQSKERLELQKEQAERDKLESDRDYALEGEKLKNELNMSEKELELRVESEREQSELALLRLILASESAEDRAYYLQLLRNYAGEDLAELADGKEAELPGSNDLHETFNSILSDNQVRQKVVVMRNFLRTEAERRDFYEKSGLSRYLSYDEAMSGMLH